MPRLLYWLVKGRAFIRSLVLIGDLDHQPSRSYEGLQAELAGSVVEM
jgi:hypothetical protein